MEYIAAGLADWLSRPRDLEVEFVGSADWRERERRFDSGDIDVVWICGLPYVWKADDPSSQIELLAAPVMAAERYCDRPIYFSDVVVRRRSEIRGFAGLRGARWAYNEPGSHSGFNLVRANLATRGLDWSYFGRVVESGSHQRSLELIIAGEIDGSAIDSTVLEEAIARDPTIVDQVRVIESLGPSPIPPLIVRRAVAPELRRRLRRAMISIADSEAGRRLLRELRLRRLAAVKDEDYDAIRQFDRQAAVLGHPQQG